MGAAPRAGAIHTSRHRDTAKARVLIGGTRPARVGRLGRVYRQRLRCDNSGLISHPFNDALLRTHSIPLFCRREPPHQGRHNATRILSLQKRVHTFVMRQSQASNQELSTIVQHPIINVQPGRSMLHIFLPGDVHFPAGSCSGTTGVPGDLPERRRVCPFYDGRCNLSFFWLWFSATLCRCFCYG
jgi:hypothetical protein